CGQLTGKVLTQDKEWFDKCPPEARQKMTKIHMEAFGLGAFTKISPNFIAHDVGCEVRSGPTVASISIPGFAGFMSGRILTGSDGASVRFDKIRLKDGQELPICAYASIGYKQGFGPGIELVLP